MTNIQCFHFEYREAVQSVPETLADVPYNVRCVVEYGETSPQMIRLHRPLNRAVDTRGEASGLLASECRVIQVIDPITELLLPTDMQKAELYRVYAIGCNLYAFKDAFGTVRTIDPAGNLSTFPHHCEPAGFTNVWATPYTCQTGESV